MLDPRRNCLLAALTPAAQRRLFPRLDLIEFKPNVVVYQPYEPMRHGYFPIDCIVSTMCESQDGDSVECGVTGSEGIVAVPRLLGAPTTSRWTIAQRGGHAYRLDARILDAEFASHGELYRLLLSYIGTMLSQAAQLAVCNRHHTVVQQVSRWLLGYADRAHSDDVPTTHQRIADTLGVRREGVTLAARRLQKLGAISCRRGDISLLDRARLERSSCECYLALRNETDRLWSQSRGSFVQLA